MKIGSLNSIPWYLRLAIFVVLAIGMYAGFWYFVTRGTRQETKELNDKIAVLQKANMEAQIASQRLNEFRTAYKNKQEELDELRALLPEQRELTNVLQGIQDRARATSLQVRRFTPKDDVQQDFYSGKKIDVAVQSSFAGLRAFFDQMAKYQRIVSITNFEVKQLDKQLANKTLEARFDLTAYYVSSEKLQKQATPPPPAGTQPAPPAPGK
ncbi:MAG TPA: type 4a pilus biogenesis protein PilO [Pyrinomonadaceae bacterium]|jgi:Tfp pilus assembly protein PilO|nr:type 4a pilus biogenesis protein PilO [Pyrinomonadaceae bacterium]